MTLDDIELPDDLEWTDEFSWSPVEQSTQYGATGSLFIQESTKQAGRTITLRGEPDMCWVERQTVLALQALRNQTDKVMTLVLSDDRTFSVRFVQSATPIDVAPVQKGAFFDNKNYYKINEIKLMEV